MDEIVKQVSEKTGLSDEMSRTAVIMVANWIKGKLPASVQPMIDGFLSGQGGDAGGGGIEGMVGGAMGGMFGGD